MHIFDPEVKKLIEFLNEELTELPKYEHPEAKVVKLHPCSNKHVEEYIRKLYKKCVAEAKKVANRFYMNDDDCISDMHFVLQLMLRKDELLFESDSQFLSYVGRGIHNMAINKYRKDQVIGYKLEIDDPEVIENPLISYQLDTELVQITNQIVSILHDKLSVEYKKVFELWFMQGRKYHEIAEIVNIPIGTVKTQVHRIRHLAKKHCYNLYKQLGFTDNFESDNSSNVNESDDLKLILDQNPNIDLDSEDVA